MRSLLTRLAAVSALAVTGVAVPATAHAATPTTTFTSASIANRALARVGTWGGQCKQFVNDMASLASGGAIRLGGGYYSDFLRTGAARTDAAHATTGDVIQLNNPYHRDRYYRGMHTAIVVANLGNGTFRVVDSNWVGPGRVGSHTWTPRTTANRNGLEINFWHYRAR